jgi:hypothetical protein
VRVVQGRCPCVSEPGNSRLAVRRHPAASFVPVQGAGSVPHWTYAGAAWATSSPKRDSGTVPSASGSGGGCSAGDDVSCKPAPAACRCRTSRSIPSDAMPRRLAISCWVSVPGAARCSGTKPSRFRGVARTRPAQAVGRLGEVARRRPALDPPTASSKSSRRATHASSSPPWTRGTWHTNGLRRRHRESLTS